MATRLLRPTDGGRRLRMTYEEFRAWADEDTRAEWVDGEVVEFIPQGKRRIRLIFFLIRLIGWYADLRQLGEVYGEPFEFWTRPNRALRRPDIAFLKTDHLDRFTDEGVVGPVDLAVEVVSEDSVVRDRQEKLAEYAAAGVPEYWIVEGREGERGVVFYELLPGGSYAPIPADPDGRLRSKVLPGFWLDPAWLDQEPLPNPLGLLRQMAPDALRAFATPGGEA